MTDPTPTPDPQGPQDPAPTEATPEPAKGKRTPFDAPQDADGSGAGRFALYDRTEGRYVTGPVEADSKRGAKFNVTRDDSHTYATVRV